MYRVGAGRHAPRRRRRRGRRRPSRRSAGSIVSAQPERHADADAEGRRRTARTSSSVTPRPSSYRPVAPGDLHGRHRAGASSRTRGHRHAARVDRHPELRRGVLSGCRRSTAPLLAPEPVFADAVFPTKLQTVQTYADPRGQRQRLVLVVGQFAERPDGKRPGAAASATSPRSAHGSTTRRRVQTDFTPAQFGLDRGGSQVGQAGGVLRPRDRRQCHRRQARARRLPRRSNTWKFVDLQPSASDPTLWTGGGPSTTTNPEFFVQAVDGAGNVSVTSYKGRYYLDAAGAPF